MNPSLALRQVTLRVAQLARSTHFYEQLGFIVTRRDATSADFATTPGTPPLLSLREDQSASAAPRNSAGLFHAALLFPSRMALGGWLLHAVALGVEFDGASDHLVSEAIYFSDPDGNGLEFYADRARTQWPMTNGQVEMTTRALDVPALLNVARRENPPLAGAHWGHLHLRVIDLDASENFYAPLLGLSVTQRNYPGARFLAADGYHHHLGLNVWGSPRLLQPENALGLVSATFGRQGAESSRVHRDPNGIRIQVDPL